MLDVDPEKGTALFGHIGPPTARGPMTEELLHVDLNIQGKLAKFEAETPSQRNRF